MSTLAMALGLGGCTTPKSQTAVRSAALLTSPVTITAISTQTLSDAVQISVESTGELQYTAFKLQEPPRLVVDLAAAQLAKNLQPLSLTAGIVSGIEPLELPEQEMVRLLIHLRRMASHSLEVREQQLHITLSEASLQQAQEARPMPTAAAAMPAPTLTSPPSTALVPAAPAAVATVVTKVEFTTSPETSVVVVHTSGMQPHIRVKQRKQPLRLSVDVVHARLSPAQDKIMGIHDPGGVVTQLQALQVLHGNEETVHITVYLRAKTPFEVLQEGNTVRVILAKLPLQSPPPQTTAALVQAAPAMATSSPALDSFVTPATTGAAAVSASSALLPARQAAAPETASGAVREETAGAPPASSQGFPAPLTPVTIGEQNVKRYTGEKISLDFQNADINDILRLIAEVSGLNVIAGPDVKGTVTTRMMDVPWDQALDVILKINGLGQEREEDIIRVAPLERFINERKERIRARETAIQIEPTVTQIVPINYADATLLMANLEKLLSARGSIFVDARTNTMIITDTKQHIRAILVLVETLDRQTPQVMIEVRIVEATRDFSRELGVRFGGRFTQITERNFPNVVSVGGNVDPGPGNFLVDLPAAVGAGSGGAIGVVLSGVGSLLDLELSALESSGKAKIISNPRVVTLDNTEAFITSGVRIPFSTRSDGGTQTEFVDASINLRVTPHVTPDGFISMKINAAKNEPNQAVTSAEGQPSITTREASTEMLVSDGDTVVIAGLYKRDFSFAEDGVPGLSKIPVLGWLFKKQRRSDTIEELLIFITPRIIKQPKSLRRELAPVTY